MENAGRITFFVILCTLSVAQSNLMLMILFYKSVVFRITETSYHIIHVYKNEREIFDKIAKIMLG